MKLTLALAAILVAYVKADGHEWKTVNKGTQYELDFEQYSLEIEADSTKNVMATTWYNPDGNEIGSIFMGTVGSTDVTATYQIKGCTSGQKTATFSNAASQGTTWIWKYTMYKESLHIMCNEEEIIHIEFKDCDASDWKDKQVKKFEFINNMDQASLRYRRADRPVTDATDSGSGTEYKVTYSIWREEGSGTYSAQYVQIGGFRGETREYECSDSNFNVVNRDVECVFQSDVDIGDYKYVALRTGSFDGLDFTRVTVEIDNREVHQIEPVQAEYIRLEEMKTLKFYVAGCPEGYWTCADKQQCIRNDQECDAEKNCWDGSDVANENCATENCDEGQKRCENGQCIIDSYWCDGSYDCDDRSDETMCDKDFIDCGDKNNFDHPDCYSAAQQVQIVSGLLMALTTALLIV